jgi:hypothetical protein
VHDIATQLFLTTTLISKLKLIPLIITSESSLIKMKSSLKNWINSFKQTRQSDKDLTEKLEYKKSDREMINN